MSRSHFRIGGLAVCLLLQHACGENTVAPPEPAALRIAVSPSSAETMKPLSVQPRVEVVDAAGNAVPTSGIVVTAAVISGNGKVVAGASAQTQADGVAAFQTLTIGALDGAVGTVTVQFSTADGLQIASPIELACSLGTGVLGTTITDALVDGDCADQLGRLGKAYAFTVAAPTKALRVRQQSGAFTPYASVNATNDPAGLSLGWVGGGIAFIALVPPGIVRVRASAFEQLVAGSFTLDVTATPEDPVTCQLLQFHTPVTTTQTLTSACTDASGNVGDVLHFVLVNGARIDATLSSSAFTPFGAVFESGVTTPVTSATATGSTVSLTFTNQTGGARIYYLFAGSSSGSATGEYTLQATITGVSSASAATINERDVVLMAPLGQRTLVPGGRGQKH